MENRPQFCLIRGLQPAVADNPPRSVGAANKNVRMVVSILP